MGTAPKDATDHTRAVNAPRDFTFDERDFERAERGLLITLSGGTIDGPFGPVFDYGRYDFVERGSVNPDTVHPSLWRQAQLNGVHGLFEVAPGVWQARGYDISNVTFIAGQTGWIVIDPLTVAPCAKACLDLANAHLGERPVVAVIYTHSHADHFGGVLGVTSREDVEAGRCRIIAPEHFMRETVGENVIAGYAMTRRALYQFGPLLPAGPRQHVDCGLGKAIPLWVADLIAPTEDITATGQELDVDGVRVVFQLTPESEAPAEMNFFFPDHGWLCTAENCTHTMHNLVPIRGALIRDSLKWSKYIGEAIEMFGRDTELMFASHHWPRWGNADVMQYLVRQRDLYRWMHDQTMRHANHGLNATEIAEVLELPPEFAAEGHTTGYYGDLVHNVKAVFQRYLSWYDGNPANLWKLPPVEAGRRYVELAGGADALLAQAQRAFDGGEYRWVAELVNHLVFADPTNTAARELQADTFEQLGYQSQSATFRNAYLMGAQELRHGTPDPKPVTRSSYHDAMDVEQIFDSLAVKVKSEEVGGLSATINFSFTDLGEDWVLELSNRTLHAVAGRHRDGADVTFRLTKHVLQQVIEGSTTFAAAVEAGAADARGDVSAAARVFDHLDVFHNFFKLVEP
ncbi:MAG: MBL fold metallo-hydrolase [Acidimicrobiales bacterium]|nr:MBL fold metallo-hydrolase [Acidimicrobiales bacterium]